MLEFDGQEYCSFNALCRAHGLPDSTVRRRYKTLGWTLSESLGVTERETKSKYNAKRISITVEDPQKGRLEFDSIKTAAKYYELSYDLVIQRLHKHGWTVEQAFGLTPSHELDFDDFALVYLKNDESTHEIELTLNKDKTFTYQDLSNSSKQINVRGNWEVKNNTIFLKNAESAFPFHHKWKITQKGTVAKSRKGMSFYTLHKK